MTYRIAEWDDGRAWDDAAVWYSGRVTETLLPPNASRSERAIEQVTGSVATVPIQIRETWDPDLCPAELLPWLAWALGVDEWDSGWSEGAKRAAIRESVAIHRRKGTVAAIRRTLVNAGYGDAEIIERTAARTYSGAFQYSGEHDHSSVGHWAEYRVKMARPITIEQAGKVRSLIEAVAPLRCHLVELSFQTAAFIHNSRLRYDGAATYGAA